jgi:hypothetical protein
LKAERRTIECRHSGRGGDEMECKFHVGQRVVCIEDTIIPPKILRSAYPVVPIKGNIYTIRELTIGAMGKKPCLRFDEIADEVVSVFLDGQVWDCTPAWEASGFRPLVTRKTDISQFKAMLTPSKVPA